MKDMGFLIFILFIIIFILLLTGGSIIKYIKKARLKAKKDALNEEQKYRDEIGRQQLQYHYNGSVNTGKQEARPRAEEEAPKTEKPQVEEPVEIHTKTATGETIIDRRGGRENKKIYEEAEGEYVEFSEE
jgi:predicted Holliday junction resolvase-like endonuclease